MLAIRSNEPNRAEGVLPPEPARPARAQPTSSDWWARPLVEPRSACTAGDEGEPGWERVSLSSYSPDARISFIAPQKKCSALGTPTQPPFRERVRLGTAVRKVSSGTRRAARRAGSEAVEPVTHAGQGLPPGVQVIGADPAEQLDAIADGQLLQGVHGELVGDVAAAPFAPQRSTWARTQRTSSSLPTAARTCFGTRRMSHSTCHGSL